MLYEKIEERGLDYVLERYSKAYRDRCLTQMSSEDLIMFSVIGMTAEEMEKLFSRKVMEREFCRLPAENLFYSMESMEGIWTRKSFLISFDDLDQKTFVDEYRKSPSSLFQMIDLGLLRSEEVLEKLKHVRLEELFRLKRYHRRFEKILRPLEELLYHTLFIGARRAYSRDVAKLIVEFI